LNSNYENYKGEKETREKDNEPQNTLKTVTNLSMFHILK